MTKKFPNVNLSTPNAQTKQRTSKENENIFKKKKGGLKIGGTEVMAMFAATLLVAISGKLYVLFSYELEKIDDKKSMEEQYAFHGVDNQAHQDQRLRKQYLEATHKDDSDLSVGKKGVDIFMAASIVYDRDWKETWMKAIATLLIQTVIMPLMVIGLISEYGWQKNGTQCKKEQTHKWDVKFVTFIMTIFFMYYTKQHVNQLAIDVQYLEYPKEMNWWLEIGWFSNFICIINVLIVTLLILQNETNTLKLMKGVTAVLFASKFDEVIVSDKAKDIISAAIKKYREEKNKKAKDQKVSKDKWFRMLFNRDINATDNHNTTLRIKKGFYVLHILFAIAIVGYIWKCK